MPITPFRITKIEKADTTQYLQGRNSWDTHRLSESVK